MLSILAQRAVCLLLMDPPRSRLRHGTPARMGAAADFLVERLECSPQQALLAEAKMLPNLAASLDSAAADHVCTWLTSRLELDAPQARKFFLTSPTLLRMPVAKLDQRLQFLTVRLDLSDAQLRKLVSTLPATLGMLPASMEQKIAYLERRLGLSPPQLRKLVCTAPGALSRSVEGTLMPKLDAVQTRLGLSEAELGALVVRFPAVIGYSYEAKVAPTLDKLQATCTRRARAMHMRRAHALCTRAHSCTCVTCTYMHMQARLHLDESELRHCVRRLPALLGYSHEANIAPKLDRLQAHLSEALTLTTDPDPNPNPSPNLKPTPIPTPIPSPSPRPY